jgi:hypothetical protein
LEEILIEPRYDKIGLMPWFDIKTKTGASPAFVDNGNVNILATADGGIINKINNYSLYRTSPETDLLLLDSPIGSNKEESG